MKQFRSEKTKTTLLVALAVSFILAGVYLRTHHGSSYGLTFIAFALFMWLRFGRN